MEGGVHGLHLGPLETPADIETCVALMRASDPWQRLRITEDACRRTITCAATLRVTVSVTRRA